MTRLLLATVVAAQVVSVPALLETMGVKLDGRGAEGAFDDGLRPRVQAQPGVYSPLATLMAGGDVAARVDAAYAFGIIAGPGARAVPPGDLSLAGSGLAQMMAADNRRLRVAGARVSGRLFTTPFSSATPTPRPQVITDALFVLFNGKDETELLAAMDALGRLREPAATTSLIERYVYYREHGSRALAGGSVEALARIGHVSAQPLVSGLVNDRWAGRDDATSLAVLFARERLLHDGSIAAIRQALERKSLRVQAQGYLEELRQP